MNDNDCVNMSEKMRIKNIFENNKQTALFNPTFFHRYQSFFDYIFYNVICTISVDEYKQYAHIQ